jgi:hypothetical protein
MQFFKMMTSTLTEEDGCENAADHCGREVLEPRYLRYKQFYGRELELQVEPVKAHQPCTDHSWAWIDHNAILNSLNV